MDFLYKSESAVIYSTAKIVNHLNLFLDDYSVLSDFVFINAGKFTKIGKYSKLSPYVLVTGGGELYIDPCVDVSYSVKILTGYDNIYDGNLSLPSVPHNFRDVVRVKTEIKRFSFIGTNSMILPGSYIGEGVVVEPNTVVRGKLNDWHIYGGNECACLGLRKKMKDDILIWYNSKI